MNTLTCFSLSITDHIAHLVLNRPEAMNTMHPTFWRELDEVLKQLHKSADARALVISSTGKHFSAGMALETFAGNIAMDDQSPEGRAAIFDLLTDMQATFTKLETLRIPVIAAIQGGCIGGAVDMVTACCLRYASTDAFFCIQEINIGMVADVGTLQRLPKLVPLAVVKELAYTGRKLSAAKALGYGLVNEVFDSPETLLAVICDLFRSIAAQGGRRVVLVNGHGGNVGVCHAASAAGSARFNLSVAHLDYWRLAHTEGEPPVPGHAGEFETSMVLAIRPDLVGRREPRAHVPTVPNIGAVDVHSQTVWRDIDGFTDQPELAQADEGKRRLEHVVSQTADRLVELASTL